MNGPAHRHEDLTGGALLEAAREAVTGAGEQWTPMRTSVFEMLASFTKPASAYDIADALSRKQGRRVAPNSVYRILDLLIAANAVRRVESENAYLASSHPGCRHDCIFMICNGCGETTHVDDDRVASVVREVAGELGFVASQPVLEVRGWCADCARQQKLQTD